MGFDVTLKQGWGGEGGREGGGREGEGGGEPIFPVDFGVLALVPSRALLPPYV